MFVWPTDTKRITSHFRPSHRLNHNGLDIAEAGYHEIYAAAAGTVSRSYTSTSYGECIMIVHSINGQTWETVYAHMRAGSRKVKEGDKVKTGQVIGVMGNTGRSSGQHLHFELHKGRWNMAKSNAVDPLKYIGQATTVNTSESIVDYLNSKKIDSSKENRKKLAKEYGVSNYDFSADKNIELLNKIKAGKPAAPSQKKNTVHLPKTSSSWRVYPLNKAPVKGNEVGKLNPKKFGGLTYEILGKPQANVVTIKTSDFGKVNIYVGKDTSAVVK